MRNFACSTRRIPQSASALIYELARAGLIEAWASPAILEEYADVLSDHPEFVAEIVESFPVCYPLTELSVIRHEPLCGSAWPRQGSASPLRALDPPACSL